VINSNSIACGGKFSVTLNLLLDETDTVFSSVTQGMERKLSTLACECGVSCYPACTRVMQRLNQSNKDRNIVIRLQWCRLIKYTYCSVSVRPIHTKEAQERKVKKNRWAINLTTAFVSGIQRCVVSEQTDVSEVRTASIIRVMTALGTSETSVYSNGTTLSYIPEGYHLQNFLPPTNPVGILFAISRTVLLLLTLLSSITRSSAAS
jgi:hypothetical protein